MTGQNQMINEKNLISETEIKSGTFGMLNHLAVRIPFLTEPRSQQQKHFEKFNTW